MEEQEKKTNISFVAINSFLEMHTLATREVFGWLVFFKFFLKYINDSSILNLEKYDRDGVWMFDLN